MSTQTSTPTPTDADIKRAHRAMWASGDYPRVAGEVIPDLGADLVRACRVRPGELVLDVAAGSGNAAIPAAEAGARVVASDLTPEMFGPGRSTAAARGVELDWTTADAEDLPFDDGAFDVVLSCVGVMFAPHHGAAADQMLRVLRPGGRIGLVAWTPEGFIGQMLAAMKPYAAALPAGAQPPLLWGTEAHLHDLLGGRVTGLECRRASVRVDRFGTAQEFREYFCDYYGPTAATYRRIADDPAQVTALDAALDSLAAGQMHDGVMEWEYLLATGTRSS